MPDIKTLVDDIYAMFDTGKHHPHDPALHEEFGNNMKELFHSRFNTTRDGAPRLRMSNIGRPDRQLWYDMNYTGPKEALQPATYIKFSYGDMIEQMVLLYAKMAGHTVTDEQKEVEVEGIKGHLDAVIDGVVVDVKSASTFSFQKFQTGSLLEPGNDPFGYVAQLAGYVEAVNPGSDGAFLAVDKTLGKLHLLVVPADVLSKFKVRDRINYIKEAVKTDAPPARCYSDVPDGKSGNMKLGTGCSYCPYKFNCWENIKTYYYSTGPRYLTRVVREPRVNAESLGEDI